MAAVPQHLAGNSAQTCIPHMPLLHAPTGTRRPRKVGTQTLGRSQRTSRARIALGLSIRWCMMSQRGNCYTVSCSRALWRWTTSRFRKAAPQSSHSDRRARGDTQLLAPCLHPDKAAPLGTALHSSHFADGLLRSNPEALQRRPLGNHHQRLPEGAASSHPPEKVAGAKDTAGFHGSAGTAYTLSQSSLRRRKRSHMCRGCSLAQWSRRLGPQKTLWDRAHKGHAGPSTRRQE
jgi:hypothetical protein